MWSFTKIVQIKKEICYIIKTSQKSLWPSHFNNLNWKFVSKGYQSMGIIILDEYYDQKPNFNLKQNDFLFRHN